MQLDHLVINTRLNMDATAELFRALGFQLTPRGHHSLGSINHLMVDPASYLELVGVPETGKQRQEVLDSRIGLSGLVFRSSDAEATYRHLLAEGFAPLEPILLERPVMLDGAEHMARFRNVRMTAAEFPAGRVYFCQHLAPELVWRDEWLVHPNGFRGIASIGIASLDPEAEAARYARLAGGRAEARGGGWCVAGDGFDIAFTEGPAGFTDATLVFEDTVGIARLATDCDGADWRDVDGGGVLTIPSLGVTLLCRAA